MNHIWGLAHQKKHRIPKFHFIYCPAGEKKNVYWKTKSQRCVCFWREKMSHCTANILMCCFITILTQTYCPLEKIKYNTAHGAAKQTNQKKYPIFT